MSSDDPFSYPPMFTKKYRVVRDGIPGMDGVFKTIQIGGPYDDEQKAEETRALLSRLGHGTEARIQTCWASEWRDIDGEEGTRDDDGGSPA